MRQRLLHYALDHIVTGVNIIRVQEANNIPGACSKPLIQGVINPIIRPGNQLSNESVVGSYDVERMVGGPAIYHDMLNVAIGLAAYGLNGVRDSPCAVVAGSDNADLHRLSPAIAFPYDIER